MCSFCHRSLPFWSSHESVGRRTLREPERGTRSLPTSLWPSRLEISVNTSAYHKLGQRGCVRTRLSAKRHLAASRSWREARAVCQGTGRTYPSPTVVSRQQLIQGDRQIADADAGGVIDSVGDGRGGADDADLANALHAHGVDVGVLLVDPAHVDGSHVGVGGDVVLRAVVVDVIAEARVQHA